MVNVIITIDDGVVVCVVVVFAVVWGTGSVNVVCKLVLTGSAQVVESCPLSLLRATKKPGLLRPLPIGWPPPSVS